MNILSAKFLPQLSLAAQLLHANMNQYSEGYQLGNIIFSLISIFLLCGILFPIILDVQTQVLLLQAERKKRNERTNNKHGNFFCVRLISSSTLCASIVASALDGSLPFWLYGQFTYFSFNLFIVLQQQQQASERADITFQMRCAFCSAHSLPWFVH